MRLLLALALIGHTASAAEILTNGHPLLTIAGKPIAALPIVSGAGGPLALVDMPAGMIAQRAYGSNAAPVWYRASYTGAAPSAMQAQIVSYRNGALVQDWSDQAGLSCAAGACAGQVSTPVGGPYRMRVRDKYAPGTVVEGANPYSVGMLVVWTGQSDTPAIFGGPGYEGSETGTYGGGEPYRGAFYSPLGWCPLDSYALTSSPNAATLWSAGASANRGCQLQAASGPMIYARIMSAANGGIPVGIVPRYVGGTSFFNLFDPGGAQYNGLWPSLASTGFQNQPAGQVGDFEEMDLEQGGSDADSSLAAAQNWLPQAQNWYRRVVQGGNGYTAWLAGRRTPQQLKFYVEAIKQASSAQPYVDVIRQSQLQFVANNKASGFNVETFESTTDMPVGTVDFTNLTSAQGSMLLGRYLQTSLWGTGHAAYPGRGAKFTSGVRINATTVRLTVTQDGGTALANAAGTGVGGAVTSMQFSAAADLLSSPLTPTSVTISGANTVDVVFPSTAPVPLYWGNLRGNMMAGANPLYDNAVVAAYNPGPEAIGDNATALTTGILVQPTLGTLVVP